jgi:hypothetical protein
MLKTLFAGYFIEFGMSVFESVSFVFNLPFQWSFKTITVFTANILAEVLGNGIFALFIKLNRFWLIFPVSRMQCFAPSSVDHFSNPFRIAVAIPSPRFAGFTTFALSSLCFCHTF